MRHQWRRPGLRRILPAAMTHDLIAEFRRARVVPVVRTASAAHAMTAVEWLREAGFRIFEITMTVPDAPALMRRLSADPELLVGAGTVPDVEAARACLDAGARFLVTPWVDPAVIAATREAGALPLPGTMTPTEIRAARRIAALSPAAIRFSSTSLPPMPTKSAPASR